MSRAPLPKWGAIALWTSVLLASLIGVGYWRDADSAMLLLWWLPILYGFATLAAGRKAIREELRADARWFAVSLPKSYEHAFGYGRTFEWSDDMVLAHAAQDYAKEKVYYFDIGSGLSWFSGDACGQWLDFEVGIRSNVLVLPSKQAQRLSDTCRKYAEAAARFRVYFVIGWIVAV